MVATAPGVPKSSSISARNRSTVASSRGVDDLPSVGRRRVSEGPEVVPRLRHLLAPDLDHSRMQPVARKGATGSLGLGPLVLVVREHEIVPGSVKVEAVPEQVQRHGRALEMPAGTAGPPRRVPGRLARFGSLPEREVDGAALGLVDLDAAARRREELPEVTVRERAIPGKGRDVEVHAATLDDVGVTPVDELSDEDEHVGDVRGGVRDVIGSFDTEPVDLVPPGGFEALRELGLAGAGLVGPGDDLVLDVGDIGHQRHLQAPPPEVAANDVVDEPGAPVTDVGDVVHRWAADVDRDPPGFAELEVDLGSLQGVVDANGHRARGYWEALTRLR